MPIRHTRPQLRGPAGGRRPECKYGDERCARARRQFRVFSWRENAGGAVPSPICHIRDAEELTPFRQRGLRISQARIIFALVGVVRFLCQCCAPFGHFPCGLTFGSHLACPIAEIGFSGLLLRWLPSFFIGCVSAGVFDRAARTLTVGRIPRSGCNRRYAYFAIPSLQVRWRILMR
jgi:hypothetical protein